jgi:hypothetical protein
MGKFGLNSPRRKGREFKENLAPLATNSKEGRHSGSLYLNANEKPLHACLGEKMLSSAQFSQVIGPANMIKVSNSLNSHSLPHFPLICCENRFTKPYNKSSSQSHQERADEQSRLISSDVSSKICKSNN